MPMAYLATLLRQEADVGVPASPGAELDQCLLSKQNARNSISDGGSALPIPSVFLANLSLLCEAVDYSEWNPNQLWKRNIAIDGMVSCNMEEI